jgi:hypothetical protein
MKMNYRLRLVLAVLTGVAFLASCTPSVVKKSKGTLLRPDINLQITGNPKELRITTLGMGACKAQNPLNGCVAVPNGDIALITFRLNAPPAWSFSEIKICSGGTKASQDCNLEDWQRSEFYASDSPFGSALLYPDDNGVIDLTQLSSSLTEFVLFDFNSVKHDFFYTIKACNPSATPQCTSSDPPIENGGRRKQID